MKDYQDLFNRWFAFLTVETKTKKEILDSLHIEVKKGFDVVVKIAVEESGTQIKDQEFFNRIKEFFEASLSICVLSGYGLFLVDSQIDPIDVNLIINSSTNELGNRWMEEYEKNRHADLLDKIDPILSLFLEKIKQDEINKMLIEFEDMQTASYKDVMVIDNFLNWASHQGFILGLIEQDLLKN